jgi:hypothetical protein
MYVALVASLLFWLVYYVWPEFDQFLKGKINKFQISAHGSTNQTIYRRIFFSFFYFHILAYNQIWLNLLMDDNHHLKKHLVSNN